MDDTGRDGQARTAPAEADGGARSQPGAIGIALAAVLTAALAQGSWEWFATYIGATLLAVVLAFYRLPPWTPGLRSAYGRGLAAYSLITGLCVAIALAPLLQRSPWLFPMPGARRACPAVGRYEGGRAVAAAPGPSAGRTAADLRYVREFQAHSAVADCLAFTTTRWLPVYAGGVAVLVCLGTWSAGRARARPRAGRRREASTSA